MIKMRPHHLLCVFGWRGEGYDRVFTENFAAVVARLKQSVPVMIVRGGDDICRCCPKYEASRCRARPERGDSPTATAEAIDERVRNQLGLRDGRVYESRLLMARVQEEVRPHELGEICAGCSWLASGWCADGLQLRGHLT